MKNLKIYTDGGSRGNPGPAAFGVTIIDKNKKPIYEKGGFIGRRTNNQAEYEGLIHALDWLAKNGQGVKTVELFLDSKLVVNQMKGLFKVKAPKMRPLWTKAKQIEQSLNLAITYSHIPRELNTRADELLNKALDLLKSS